MKTISSIKGLVVAQAAVNGGMITNFGGIVARRLVEEGASLHVFASRYPVFGSPPPLAELDALGAIYHGVSLPEQFAPLRDAWTVFRMAWELKRLGVHVLHTRGAVMGAVGRVAGKLAGVPIIFHHQDDLYCREKRLTPNQRRTVAAFERSLSRLTDRTFFVSQAVLDEAIANGFDPSRCVLAGNDLTESFQQAALSPKNPSNGILRHLFRLGVPESAKIIGCIGRLAHIKGMDILIEAASQVLQEFPEWILLIKGNGPLLGPLSDTIKERGLIGRIFLLPEDLPAWELPALYRTFDLFVLPTRREGFGMVFAEAMAMGVPVVGPNIAPVTEVVPQDCGILVGPEDPVELAGVMRQVMADGSLRASLAVRGREHAMRRWCGRTTAADNALATYRAIIAEKSLSNQLA